MTAIQTINLTKKYKTKTAVDGLNLAVQQGELFALLGVNGAGKTTTIKMLCCLLAPTAGDAELMGNSVLRQPGQVKQIINLSPQETAVAPKLTVHENLMFTAKIYGSDNAQAQAKSAEMIQAFGLEDVAKDKAKTLSGGMQRRLSIAMALISQPQILFLDEPTLGLDVLARRELWAAIRRLKGNVTIILTTHYMEEAEALADRIGVMTAGKLKAIGTAAQLKERTGTGSVEDAFIALASGEVPA